MAYPAYTNQTNDCTTEGVTLDSLLKTMRLMETVCKPTHDVIVYTAESFAMFKKHSQVETIQPESASAVPLGAMPVEVHPNEYEAFRRCDELKRAGRKPMLVW